ncbi:MAG: hypothetical protein ACTHK0_02415 [Ginsengibacter sp.]
MKRRKFHTYFKKDGMLTARNKLATLAKRNPKAGASMELINEVLQDIKIYLAKRKR